MKKSSTVIVNILSLGNPPHKSHVASHLQTGKLLLLSILGDMNRWAEHDLEQILMG